MRFQSVPALASMSSCPAGNNYKEPDVCVLAPPQAVRQHNFVTWTQYVKYDKLQHLRHELTALTLAIEDMTTERCHFSSSGFLVFTASGGLCCIPRKHPKGSALQIGSSTL